MANPLTPEARAELRALAEKASQGNWMHSKEEDDDEPHAVVRYPGPGWQIGLAYIAETGTSKQAGNNAAYIAAAHPGTVLALLDAVEAAEARATKAEAERDRLAELLEKLHHVANSAPCTRTDESFAWYAAKDDLLTLLKQR